MDKIIHMNNSGASMIDRGLHKDALQVLGRALAEVQDRLKQPEKYSKESSSSKVNMGSTEEKEQEHEQDRMSDDSAASTTNHRSSLPAAEVVATATIGATNLKRQNSSWSSEENEHFIYRKPVHITEDCDCYCEGVGSLIVILVFNMALSNHLSAMDQPGSQRPTTTTTSGPSQNPQHKYRKALQLTAALKLYQLCYSMQRHGSNRALGVTHALALLNNSGHIHRELGHDRDARRCFQHLLSSLMCIVDSGDETTLVDQMDGFFTSATRPVSRCSNSMAAAAA